MHIHSVVMDPYIMYGIWMMLLLILPYYFRACNFDLYNYEVKLQYLFFDLRATLF